MRLPDFSNCSYATALPKARAGTRTAICRVIYTAGDLRELGTALFYWKPAIYKSNPQNVVEKATNSEAPLGLIPDLSGRQHDGTSIGPDTLDLIFAHQTWLRHLLVVCPSCMLRQPTIADVSSSRTIQLRRRAPGRVRRVERKVGPSLKFGTIDHCTDF